MKAKETISKDLKWDKNPRKITEKKKELLKNHIDELGDLSGVVYCHNNNAFVGGNQRTDIFDNSKIEIVEQYDKPNEKGTIAYGFINYKNERFAYREVNFTEELFKKACIVANNDGGENDWEILNTDYWDNIELEAFGLDIIGFDVNEEDMTDGFSLPDGDKAPFQQQTYTLADTQAIEIKNAIADVKKSDEYKFMETYGNENSNGNALHLIIEQWVEQRK